MGFKCFTKSRGGLCHDDGQKSPQPVFKGNYPLSHQTLSIKKNLPPLGIFQKMYM